MRKLLPIHVHHFATGSFRIFIFFTVYDHFWCTLPSKPLKNKNSLETFLMGHWRRTEITIFEKSGACHFPDSEAHLGNRPTHTPPISLSLSQLVRTFQNKFSSFRRTRASQSEWGGGGKVRICSGTCCTKRTIRKRKWGWEFDGHKKVSEILYIQKRERKIFTVR